MSPVIPLSVGALLIATGFAIHRPAGMVIVGIGLACWLVGGVAA